MQASSVDLTPRLYVLDLEVNSVPSDQGEPKRCITQICVYDPLREKGKRVFEAYVKPPKLLSHKEDEVCFEHGVKTTQRHEFKVVWPHLKSWINEGLNENQFAVILGHNIYKHDWPILENECARIQEAIPKYWKPFCTLYLAGALGVPKGGRSLTSLCKAYEVKILKAHDAYNDVVMTANLFQKLIEGANYKKICRAMVLPPKDHPVREVASIIREHLEPILVFYDFEATGLFPKKGEPGENPRAIELAAYIPSRDASFSSLIDPGLDEGITIPEVVVKLTGINENMIREAAAAYKVKTGKEMNFKAVWMDFESWKDQQIGQTAKKIAVFAGHNIWGYDNPLHKAESERFGMKVNFFKSVDTLALSRHLYKGRKGLPKGFHKMQELRKRMGIVENNAHRALGDVIVNSQVWDRFVEGVPQKKLNGAILSKHPILSIGQLIREEGGTFRPDRLLNAPNQSTLGESSSSAGGGNAAANPFLVNESQKDAASQSTLSFENEQPIIFDAKPEAGRKRARDEGTSDFPPQKRACLEGDVTFKEPAAAPADQMMMPRISGVKKGGGMEYTITFVIPEPSLYKTQGGSYSGEIIELQEEPAFVQGRKEVEDEGKGKGPQAMQCEPEDFTLVFSDTE